MFLVVVTFNDVVSVRQWRDETGCRYPMVSDEDRLLYRHFGFRGCAVRETWSVRTQVS